MSRKARFDKEGYYFHLICRGQRKNPLFFSKRDMQKYIKILNQIQQEYDLEVFAFCLMRNHVHFLVRRNSQGLHKFMQRLNTKYALYFNKKYNVVGYVFQGRYKSVIL